MIKCSSCGRTIEKVPDWLGGAKVDFVCNNCPNRNTKNIAFVSLEAEPKPAVSLDDDEDVDVEEIGDEASDIDV
jgi:hypothetical protein